ncbi:MAG: DotU family type IV/VI secretion system protein [Deltaproteobacteria bacterium]|nr:DotU family type IV/VI secretion system protein [Deltaproteobacteria bacterium]
MDRLNEITKDSFAAIEQLRGITGAVAPDALQRKIIGYIEKLRTDAREAGLTERDANDIGYALVALIDEVALSKPDPLRGFWLSRSLQMHFFGENVAGEGFFKRLETLRGQPQRKDALRAYYLCLVLGFQGQYAMRGGDMELMRLIDSVRDELERVYEFPETLSPDAIVEGESSSKRGDKRLILWVAMGALLVSMSVYIGLRVLLSGQVKSAITEVEKLR